MADSRQYTALYIVALEKLRYENRLREFGAIPRGRCFLATRPRDPYPQFSSFLMASRAFGSSFVRAHPELNMYMPGPVGPRSYDVSFVLNIERDGTLTGRSKFHSAVTRKTGTEDYVFAPGASSGKDISRRLKEDAFTACYSDMDDFCSGEAEHLSSVPLKLMSRAEKKKCISDYFREEKDSQEMRKKYDDLKPKSVPKIESLYDYLCLHRKNERIRNTYEKGRIFQEDAGSAPIAGVVPADLPFQAQLEVAESYYLNNSFALNTCRGLHLGEFIGKEIGHQGPAGFIPLSLAEICSLPFDLMSRKDFAELAMLNFYTKEEIKSFVEENEDLFQGEYPHLLAGVGNAHRFMIAALESILVSPEYKCLSERDMKEAFGYAVKGIRDAVREAGENLCRQMRIQGEKDREENEALGREIKEIVARNPNGREFVRLSDGRSIIPEQIRVRPNGDWEGPVYLPDENAEEQSEGETKRGGIRK